MPHRNRFIALVALACATWSSAACGESPVDAAQSSPTAMFAQILDKLDDIEARIDSLEAAVEAGGDHDPLLAKLDTIGSELDGIAAGSGGGGEVVLTGLHAEQLDSLMSLASFIAGDMVAGGAEVCASFAIGGEIAWESGAEGEGKGVGSLGAWAGTGLYAGIDFKGKAAFKGGLKAGGGGGIEYCHPLFAGSPETRAVPAGPLRNPALDPLESALDGFTSQFSLDATRLTQALGGVGTTVSAASSLDFQSVGTMLPLPSALASIAGDPIGVVTGRLDGLRTTAEDAICTASFAAPLATVVDEGCDIVAAGGIANFSVMAQIASTYPTIETAVTDLQSTVSGITSTYPAVQTAARAVCQRVNTIGNRSLNIPSRSIDLGALGTYTTFPGFSWEVFPGYTSVTCP